VKVTRQELADARAAKPLDKLPEHLSWLRFPEFDRLESIDLSGIAGLSYDFLAPSTACRSCRWPTPA
jgi:hypothetical protein